MAAAPHLHAVPDQADADVVALPGRPDPAPGDVTAAVEEIGGSAQALYARLADGEVGMDGDALIAVRDALTAAAADLASCLAWVDARANEWAWEHGTYPTPNLASPVCEMGGRQWRPALTGGGKSLKADAKRRIFRQAGEPLAAYLSDIAGGTPGDDIDRQVRLIVSVAVEKLAGVFTPEPLAEPLRAGLPGHAAGDGPAWRIDVARFRTETKGVRRKTITEYKPAPEGGSAPEKGTV